MNITWAYPAFLLLVPLILALFLLRRHQHVRSLVARPKMKHLLASPSGVSKSVEPVARARRGAGWFGLVALCLAAMALARPQWGETEQKTYERSREVVIALDLSRSMLATDVQPNRLDRAKLLVDSLVRELQGERIGLVVFAGTSFVQCPLSNDYEILREMLKEVNPYFLPQQGTDFGKLLQTAYKAFDFSSSSDRFLIVLSDGEDLAGDWESQLKNFIDSKIHIISLGVGTPGGSVIPEKNGGVIKDEKGAVVLSRLDSRVLQQLADQTAGRYVDAYRWVDLSKVLAETVEQGEKGSFAKKNQVLKVERFQIPLGLALLFALLSLWRDFPVYPRHSIKKPSHLEKSLGRRLKRKTASPAIPTATALLFLLLLPLSLSAQQMPPPPGAEQPKPGEKLSGTVGALSARDNLVAPDYAHLAEETIGYGKALQQAKANIEMGAVDDALLGVDEGESLDAKAADWPKLRKELEDLKKKASDQQKQKQDQQKQDKQNKDKNQKQDQQKKDSGGSGNDDQDKQNQDPSQSDQNSGKDQKDQKQKDQKDQDSKNQDSKDQKPGQNGQDQQKQDGQGQNKSDEEKDKNPNQNQGQDPKENKDREDSKNQPQPGPGSNEKKEPQPETKKVGGGGSNGQKSEKEEAPDAQTAEMVRKLDQIKEKDSPGKIYQLFSPQQPSKENKGKTW